MFKIRKTDHYPGSPGPAGAIFAVLLVVLMVISLFSSANGNTPYIIIGCIALFCIWWVYTWFFAKTRHNEFAKYQKAVQKQKKKSPPRREKGKVIYLDRHKRK